jgi:Mrp family chromosome partitioning ATPase
MSSDRMTSLVKEASEAYDVVLMDTPPVLAVADTVPLLEVFDRVLLVARLGQTTRHAASRFKELVERLSGVNFAGVIANDRREQLDDGYGTYYGYGYYGYDAKRRAERKRKRRTEPTAKLVESAVALPEQVSVGSNETRAPESKEQSFGREDGGRPDEGDALAEETKPESVTFNGESAEKNSESAEAEAGTTAP